MVKVGFAVVPGIFRRQDERRELLEALSQVAFGAFEPSPGCLQQAHRAHIFGLLRELFDIDVSIPCRSYHIVALIHKQLQRFILFSLSRGIVPICDDNVFR